MKIKIAITIDEDVLEEIKKLSCEDDRSISSQINKILKDFFKQGDC